MSNYCWVDPGDEEGVRTRKRVEIVELEIRGRSDDEWSFLRPIWEPHQEILQERCYPCKTWDLREQAYTILWAFEMHKEQAVLVKVYWRIFDYVYELPKAQPNPVINRGFSSKDSDRN